MNTFMAKSGEVERKWYVVDAAGKTLGRLASPIASILRGKNKPIYTPHVECGDYVIVVNCEKVVLTGNKVNQKTYVSYSGYVGGRKEHPYKLVLMKKPEFVLYHAVKGMLPRSILGRKALKNLRLFVGPNHNHQAQQPELLDL